MPPVKWRYVYQISQTTAEYIWIRSAEDCVYLSSSDLDFVVLWKAAKRISEVQVKAVQDNHQGKFLHFILSFLRLCALLDHFFWLGQVFASWSSWKQNRPLSERPLFTAKLHRCPWNKCVILNEVTQKKTKQKRFNWTRLVRSRRTSDLASSTNAMLKKFQTPLSMLFTACASSWHRSYFWLQFRCQSERVALQMRMIDGIFLALQLWIWCCRFADFLSHISFFFPGEHMWQYFLRHPQYRVRRELFALFWPSKECRCKGGMNSDKKEFNWNFVLRISRRNNNELRVLSVHTVFLLCCSKHFCCFFPLVELLWKRWCNWRQIVRLPLFLDALSTLPFLRAMYRRNEGTSFQSVFPLEDCGFTWTTNAVGSSKILSKQVH